MIWEEWLYASRKVWSFFHVCPLQMKSQSSEAENLKINVVWNVVGMQRSMGGPGPTIRELVLPRIVFTPSGIGDVASYSRSAGQLVLDIIVFQIVWNTGVVSRYVC